MNRYRKHVYSKLFHTACIVVIFIVLSSCSKTTECDFEGKHETRKLKDCDGEIEYQTRAFNLRIGVLNKIKIEGSKVLYETEKADNVLKLLQLRNKKLCERWNNCEITEEEYNEKSEQLEKTFTSFIMILEFAKLSNLADPVVSEQFRKKLIEWSEDAAGEDKDNEKITRYDFVKFYLGGLQVGRQIGEGFKFPVKSKVFGLSYSFQGNSPFGSAVILNLYKNGADLATPVQITLPANIIYGYVAITQTDFLITDTCSLYVTQAGSDIPGGNLEVTLHSCRIE
ncbi:MAG: hypothetical protein AAB013_00830 [Planctomycetota bacterium]